MEQLTATSSTALTEAERLDLANALNSMTGVAGVEVREREIRVRYDRDYVSPTTLHHAMTNAGYPVTTHQE